ncbi:O-antigen ligase family protein [Hoeflea sp. CAU 1731]
MRGKYTKHGARPIHSLVDKVRINYAGIVIVLAMLLGGGTIQRLWTDHIVQITMLPALVIGLLSIDKWRLDTLSKTLVFMIVFLCLLQFIPLNLHDLVPAAEGLAPQPRFWTLSAQGSLESILFTLPLLGFFVFISCFGEYEQHLLIRYLFLGFIINLVAGVIELSHGTGVQIEGVFPFTITSGLFANQNHFSTLVFMMIPLIAWRFMWYEKQPLIYIVLALLLVIFLFAVGSRAGMGISAALAIFCLFWKATEKDSAIVRIGAIIVLLLLAAVSAAFLESGSSVDGDLRLIFYKNTIKAISEHWLVGTGLGTFIFIYPMFEPQEDMTREFANHAHNDWLELILEIGFLFFIPLIALLLILLFRHAMRTPLTQAATLSVLAVLLHSLVDYPLRTMAISTTFTVLLAIILSKGQVTFSPASEQEKTSDKRRRKDRVEKGDPRQGGSKVRTRSNRPRNLAEELLPQSHRSRKIRPQEGSRRTPRNTGRSPADSSE